MGKLLERFLPALKITADQRKPVSKKPVSDKPEWVYSHNKFNMFATVANYGFVKNSTFSVSLNNDKIKIGGALTPSSVLRVRLKPKAYLRLISQTVKILASFD